MAGCSSWRRPRSWWRAAGPAPAWPGDTGHVRRGAGGVHHFPDNRRKRRTGTEGVLAPPERATTAFTYNPALAPEGATIKVGVDARGSSTEVRLDVDGLLPSRGYAAHAHVNPCGPTGDVAGPHFQNQVDPAAAPGKPSTDPAYANPQNEIWLDLRTDGAGDGGSRVEVPFTFTDRAPASIVIHEAETTGTAPGQAGSAGARLACITVPFR